MKYPREPLVVAAAIVAASLFGNVTSAWAQSVTTAFVNVNVIPMDSERVLPGHTVIVEGETIVAVGPAG